MVEAPSSATTQLGDDLARALVRRGLDRDVGQAAGRRRRRLEPPWRPLRRGQNP